MTNVPSYVPGHGLLAGKRVLVTAAAGSGIGFATAKRCVEEGAQVVISDKHERRLAESAADLGVQGIPCDVTSEEQVQALFDRAIDELGGLDVLVNNAGLGGTAEVHEMTDDQWGLVLDVTLNSTFRCVRAALTPDVRPGPRRDRQQRLRAGLAGAGRSGPLRRGQGRGDGADPLCGDRGRAPGRADQRRVAVDRDARQPRQGDERRTARRAHVARGVQARRRAVGGRQRDRLPRRPTTRRTWPARSSRSAASTPKVWPSGRASSGLGRAAWLGCARRRRLPLRRSPRRLGGRRPLHGVVRLPHHRRPHRRARPARCATRDHVPRGHVGTLRLAR